MKRRLIIGGVIALALIAAITIVFALVERHGRYEYSGTVETREIQIGSKVGGRVTEVGVEEGQTVKSGSLLVRFECDELKAQRAQAQASSWACRLTYAGSSPAFFAVGDNGILDHPGFLGGCDLWESWGSWHHGRRTLRSCGNARWRWSSRCVRRQGTRAGQSHGSGIGWA